MTKITFKNLPDTSTPLNASNLNTLQDNVENAIDAVAASIIAPDDAVSTISTNAVENQAITNYVDGEVQDAKDYTDNEISDTKDYVDAKGIYSTSQEAAIGKWIDNKTLYRKVITGTLADGDKVVDLSTLNIDTLTNSYGRCGTTGNYRPLNFYLSGYYISTRYSGGNMYIAASSAYANEPFELIVEYTKN